MKKKKTRILYRKISSHKHKKGDGIGQKISSLRASAANYLLKKFISAHRFGVNLNEATAIGMRRFIAFKISNRSYKKRKPWSRILLLKRSMGEKKKGGKRRQRNGQEG